MGLSIGAQSEGVFFYEYKHNFFNRRVPYFKILGVALLIKIKKCSEDPRIHTHSTPTPTLCWLSPSRPLLCVHSVRARCVVTMLVLHTYRISSAAVTAAASHVLGSTPNLLSPHARVTELRSTFTRQKKKWSYVSWSSVFRAELIARLCNFRENLPSLHPYTATDRSIWRGERRLKCPVKELYTSLIVRHLSCIV